MKLTQFNTLVENVQRFRRSNIYIEFGPNDRGQVGQAVFAISNSPKSRNDEVMISKMTLRIDNDK